MSIDQRDSLGKTVIVQTLIPEGRPWEPYHHVCYVCVSISGPATLVAGVWAAAWKVFTDWALERNWWGWSEYALHSSSHHRYVAALNPALGAAAATAESRERILESRAEESSELAFRGGQYGVTARGQP